MCYKWRIGNPLKEKIFFFTQTNHRRSSSWWAERWLLEYFHHHIPSEQVSEKPNPKKHHPSKVQPPDQSVQISYFGCVSAGSEGHKRIRIELNCESLLNTNGARHSSSHHIPSFVSSSPSTSSPVSDPINGHLSLHSQFEECYLSLSWWRLYYYGYAVCLHQSPLNRPKTTSSMALSATKHCLRWQGEEELSIYS